MGKGKKLFDLHIHSNFSCDSYNTVRAIINTAKKGGLSGIAITDHDTIRGGIEGKKYSDESFMVIVGAEYSTHIGHILGLFLKEEISCGLAPEKIIKQIHRQGGIAILAHPFKYLSMIPPHLLKTFDGIEIFNSRAENVFWYGQNNRRALWLSQLLGRGRTGGSDAHFLFEIGRTTWACDCKLSEEEIRKGILEGRGEVEGVGTTPFVECISQIVKSLKTKRWQIALRASAKTAWLLLSSVTILAAAWLKR
jgi:hypothetical protein